MMSSSEPGKNDATLIRDMNMIGRIIRTMESISSTPKEWLVGLVAVMSIRIFLENFSAITSSTYVTTDPQTIVHYMLYYVNAMLMIGLVLHIATGKDMRIILRVILYTFPVIIIAPVVDLMVQRGGAPMAYLFQDGYGLLYNFLTFLGGSQFPGATTGIRVECAAIVLGAFIYVYEATKSIMRSIGAAFSVYGVLFLLGSVLSLIFFSSESVVESVRSVLHRSPVASHFFHPLLTFKTGARTLEMRFNMMLAQLLFLSTCVGATIVFMRAWRTQTIAFLKNARIERVIYYWSLLILGVGFAVMENGNGVPPVTLIEVTTLLTLLMSFACAWLFAVAENDIVDERSDRISNKTRPLIMGTLNPEEMRVGSVFMLLFALLGGFVSGHHAFFFTLLFCLMSWFYSVPPFRVKRFLLINPLIVSLCGLCVFLAGYFTFVDDPRTGALPLRFISILVFCLFSIANVKDIKDKNADEEEGVWTIPVVFGVRNGKRIIAFLIACALFFVASVVNIKFVWMVSVSAIVMTYYLLMKEPFRERRLFYVFYVYIILFLLSLWSV